jgi:hypothetical protein
MTETTVSAELWKTLTEALGLAEDADAETVVAAVEDVVTTPDLDPAKAATVAAAAGLTMVDPDSLAALQRDATRGRELAAAEAKRQVSSVVMAAIGKGKIPPARREHWVTLLAADPTMKARLDAMPDNMVPLVEIGHASAVDEGIAERADWFR